MALKGKPQVQRAVDIHASRDVVWAVLSDSQVLAEWAPVVNEVTACSAKGEGVGTTRTCSVAIAGKPGTMVERCVEYTPKTRIAYVVDDETFGMRKMFDHYGFTLSLTEKGANTTNITLVTHYTPRNALYSLMNKAMMRRQFQQVCEQILEALKSYCEQQAMVDGPVRSPEI